MWFNPVMTWLLRSPLHGWVSGSVMLLMYQGRKSGKTYQVPVNYVRQGNRLVTISQPDRTWWRNFRLEAPVSLLLRGETVSAAARAVEDPAQLNQILKELVESNPAYGRFLKITRQADGQWNADDIARASTERVAVVFELPPVAS